MNKTTDQAIGDRETSFIDKLVLDKLWCTTTTESGSGRRASDHPRGSDQVVSREQQQQQYRQPGQMLSRQGPKAKDSSRRNDLCDNVFDVDLQCSIKISAVDPPSSVVDTTESSSSDSDCDSSFEDHRSPKVQFSKVYIRTHSITVGDTHFPKAYPITLDWGHTQTETIEIDLFEEIFSSAHAESPRTMIRAFRMPPRLCQGQRFNRLAEVTGQAPEALYHLESARMERANMMPSTACSCDEGYEEAHSRHHPYQMVEVDEYQMVDI
jgi:hypothetical protein